MAYGFALAYKLPLAAVLILQCVLGGAQAFYMPSNLGFVSEMKPDNAAAAGALSLCVCFSSVRLPIILFY